MVNSRTTVYTYDKANQLVSSECNGKITKYEYDAAGRLVKEGKRSYSYSWLDKVSSVKENGVEVASFTYHMDGQIATAKANGRQENFLWDNLALISRNETEYVNEPYVTGGNPILADGDVLFNDLLGTTIGIRSGKEYRETGMTAFGETDEKSAMFTGKPYIGELGYAFLFRNYRPGLGKWQTSDPLGYPDGWNNFAYCNNFCTYSYDILGAWLGIDDCVAMLTGAVLGASIQTVSNVIQGKDWHDGVAQAAAVGMVSAEAGLYGGPVIGAAAGAATNAALSAIDQGIDSLFSGTVIKTDEILEDAALDFASSVITAGVLPPGTISGQGSITAVSQQMMTKLKNGIIQNLKNSTQIKTLIGNIIKDSPDALTDHIYRNLLDLSKGVGE